MRCHHDDLFHACSKGHVICVQEMLDYADINAHDSCGMSALMIAAERGHAEIVKLLLPGSDIKARDKCGMSALIYAALNGHTEIVELIKVYVEKCREAFLLQIYDRNNTKWTVYGTIWDMNLIKVIFELA